MKKFDADLEYAKITNNRFRIRKKVLVIFLCLEILTLIGISYAYYLANDTETMVSGVVGEFEQVDFKLKVYLNDQLAPAFPAVDAGYTFSHATCDNGSTVSWDNANWLLEVTHSNPDYCQIYFTK